MEAEEQGSNLCSYVTYQGTWHTLVNNLGFDPKEAKQIEDNYHELYKASDEWVQDKLLKASKDGYIEVAFGLRVRTPVLHKTLLNRSHMPFEAAAEGRTAGNALGQSYGLLNNYSAIKFMEEVAEANLSHQILPIAQIHDSQYYLVKADPNLLAWINNRLINAMCTIPCSELIHSEVGLEAELEVLYPNMSCSTKLSSNATAKEIYEMFS